MSLWKIKARKHNSFKDTISRDDLVYTFSISSGTLTRHPLNNLKCLTLGLLFIKLTLEKFLKGNF